MKKALNSFLIMCLITAQMLLPIKAYAIAPIVWAFGASAALHAGALLFKLDDVRSPASAPSSGGSASGGVSFKLDGKPTVTPPGWSSPTTPPSSAESTINCTWGGNTFTDAAAFASWLTKENAAAGRPYSYTVHNAAACQLRENTGAIIYSTASTVCPSGYTRPNGTCVLSDPTLVKKPPETPCEFVYKAGKFVPDSQNPSCVGKATNTISVTGCDLTTSFEKMSMNCPSTNSTLEMTPTQLSGTSEAGSFSVPAAVDESGVYTVTVPANLGILPPSDKITVDFYGSVNGGQWGCIDGHCKNTATGSTGGAGGDTGGSTGGTTGDTTGGSTGGTTGGTTGGGTGTGTGDASGPTTGDGSGDSWLDDVEGFFDGAVGKIKSFFTGGADDAAPSNTPIDKSNVSLQLKTGDSYMSGGQCPPPQRIAVQFYGPATIIEIPYTMFCDLASMLRPVVIAISYLTAGYIIFRRN